MLFVLGGAENQLEQLLDFGSAGLPVTGIEPEAEHRFIGAFLEVVPVVLQGISQVRELIVAEFQIQGSMLHELHPGSSANAMNPRVRRLPAEIIPIELALRKL